MNNKNDLVKLTNDKIQDLWEEIIIKENIKNITKMMGEIKNDQNQTRQIIREELTKLWNTSEIPTFKIILEKLKNLEEEKSKNIQIIKNENITKQPEMVPINAWRRTKEPVMVDISKMKPNIPESVNKVLQNLSLLQKEGKF